MRIEGKRRTILLVAPFVVAIACVTSVSTQVATVPFPPVDEAVRDPELMAVRAALIRATLRRDLPTLGSFISKDYFGGEPVRSLALERFQPEEFVALGDLLSNGGAFRRPDYFCAPYWEEHRLAVVQLPDNMVDERLPAAVFLPDTPVFERPDAGSRVVAHLGLVLVAVVDEAIGEFTPIALDRGRAFVRTAAISPPDRPQYACLARVDGQWRLAAFQQR